MARSRSGLGLALALAAAVVVADQATKWIIVHEAAGHPYRIVGGLRLDLTYNSGISFSRLAGAGDVVIYLVGAIVVGVSIALALCAPRYRPALGVILGGALGNLIDRLRYDGAVADFIRIYSYPAFNVADIAIVVGTILLALVVIRGQQT